MDALRASTACIAALNLRNDGANLGGIFNKIGNDPHKGRTWGGDHIGNRGAAAGAVPPQKPLGGEAQQAEVFDAFGQVNLGGGGLVNLASPVGIHDRGAKPAGKGLAVVTVANDIVAIFRGGSGDMPF